MLVWQMKDSACGPNSDWLIAIERQKPDTCGAVAVVHVGANIELQKVRDPRNRGSAAKSNILHEKGDNTNECVTIECVDEESVGNMWDDYFCWDPPMEKKQINPTLIHDWRACWAISQCQSLVGGDLWGAGHRWVVLSLRERE